MSSTFPPLGPAKGSSGPIAPAGWDRCTIGSQVVPGLAKCRGAIALKVDHKKKGGSDGSNPTFLGLDPQPIELEIMTFSDEDRESLAAIVGPLLPQSGKKPKPVSIDHPSLRMIGVSAVQIVGASTLDPEGPMRARMHLRLLHWLPAKSGATTTPTGAPVRTVKNNRAQANSPPSTQQGFGGPPPGLKPGA